MDSTSLSVNDFYGQVDPDATMAGFSKDWGGEGSPEEIAASLRENMLETRDVDLW